MEINVRWLDRNLLNFKYISIVRYMWDASLLWLGSKDGQPIDYNILQA